MKADEIEKREKSLEEKRQRCFEMRENLLERKRKSFDVLEKRKATRMKNMREKDFSIFLEWQRKSESDIANRK